MKSTINVLFNDDKTVSIFINHPDFTGKIAITLAEANLIARALLVGSSSQSRQAFEINKDDMVFDGIIDVNKYKVAVSASNGSPVLILHFSAPVPFTFRVNPIDAMQIGDALTKAGRQSSA